ncbi:1,4-dihydroxy-2-naphthoate polyprenyltransferase [Candidatus Poriferisocius sp.]|uniref:1,4-dihydroxy-2-naphthoate polyprenyltransferase n=1 Tax=Candidatus Poriferisocius sp. TaxID=3101276 RepID=UPI003B014269
MRTLPAAFVPVAVGTAVAVPDTVVERAIVALVVAVALQIGVNYANDYSDGIRGTDANRLGPARLVGGDLMEPARVRRAAFGWFAVAAGAGLALSIAVSPWLVAVGVACVAAAWYYTGGRRPYGYTGFGELSVFVFFGLVATAGTAYVQTEELVETLTGVAIVAGASVGLMACALLMANNLRDIPQDRASGKVTLAVRLGHRRAALLYTVLVLAAIAAATALTVAHPWTLMCLAVLPLAIPSLRIALSSASPIPLRNQTARLHLALGALLTAGLAI